MKQYTISRSLVFLGLCILAAAWIMASALNDKAEARDQNEVSQANINIQKEDQLMNHLELKGYLGLSDEQLEKILPKKEDNVTKSKIPYIKIGYEYYFPVKAIDQWLTETEAETFR
ncbi:hypothetical protein [Halobacillus sp. BBL2006]|uniref:hypothetical protein n=1 Tax=Halobacillus sp. BBL2006 TaxID=1543706 RepID=UPI00054198B3|nr:hypothetical protein [Halobacillus sp. BBL2006]KHE71793.1 hypothetical protein LD39_07925 [Halobacillus sp. BBL2006]